MEVEKGLVREGKAIWNLVKKMNGVALAGKIDVRLRNWHNTSKHCFLTVYKSTP